MTTLPHPAGSRADAPSRTRTRRRTRSPHRAAALLRELLTRPRPGFPTGADVHDRDATRQVGELRAIRSARDAG